MEGNERGWYTVHFFNTLSDLVLNSLRSQHRGCAEASHWHKLLGAVREVQDPEQKQEKQIYWRHTCSDCIFLGRINHVINNIMSVWYPQFCCSNMKHPSVSTSKRRTLELVKLMLEFQLRYSLAPWHRKKHFTLQGHSLSSQKWW